MVRPRLCPWIVVAALAAGPIAAQENESRIPVRVIGGRLVARCQVSSPSTSVPVNLWVDLERPCGLELHNKVAEPLQVEHKDGTTEPITIELPGLDLEVPGREHGDEETMEAFTRLHAPEMEEIACAGTLGARVFAGHVVTIDLPRNLIRLRRSVEAAGKPAGPEAVYVPASVAGDAIWIGAEVEGGQTRMLAIGTSRVDSVIDEDYCFEVDRPGGRVGRVEVAGMDLSGVVAWRPEQYDLVHRDGALATLGLGFLRSFRVELDGRNGWVGLTRVAELPFPTADAEFFAARAEEEAEPLASWLERHHATRLGGEAAELLLQLLIDEGAPSEQVLPALRWAHAARPEDLRATTALDVVDDLVQARRPDLAVLAGQLGIEGARRDRYPESAHRLHLRIGELLLAQGDDRGAWEHLLSAAFGLTEAVGSADRAKVNLLLGEVYERRGKLRRAMSRYVQAVISPEAGAQAVVALERLQQKLGGEPFSVDLVDKLISGKVRSMTAPTKFAADDKTDNNRCILIEHLINPHLGQKQGEVWRAFTEGGSAVFEALLSHFPRDRVAMLSYHSDDPRPVAIMNELSLREYANAGFRPLFLIDGEAVSVGACRFGDADALYDEVRSAAVRRLGRASPFAIHVDARLEGDVVQGTVEVRGPTSAGLDVQLVLAEKGVIYPGLGATVIHRMVARGILTEDEDGVAWKPVDGGMRIGFARSVAEIEAANLRFLEAYEQRGGAPATRLSTRIARDHLSVVASLRMPAGGRVVQAAQVDVRAAEGSR